MPRVHHLRRANYRKEVHCHVIGDNVIRAAMIAAALKFQCCPTKLSFTGALQIKEFAASLRRHSGRYLEQWECVLRTIAKLTVGNRPNRKEPRQIKRRPKSYKLLQTPRNPNRNAYTTAA